MRSADPLTAPFFDKNEPIVAMIEFKRRLIVASTLHLYEVDPFAGTMRRLDLQIQSEPLHAVKIVDAPR